MSRITEPKDRPWQVGKEYIMRNSGSEWRIIILGYLHEGDILAETRVVYKALEDPEGVLWTEDVRRALRLGWIHSLNECPVGKGICPLSKDDTVYILVEVYEKFLEPLGEEGLMVNLDERLKEYCP